MVSSPKANAVLYFTDGIPWISALALNSYQGIPSHAIKPIDSPKSHPMKLAVDTFSVSLFGYLSRRKTFVKTLQAPLFKEIPNVH